MRSVHKDIEQIGVAILNAVLNAVLLCSVRTSNLCERHMGVSAIWVLHLSYHRSILGGHEVSVRCQLQLQFLLY